MAAPASLLVVLISFITTLVRGGNVYCVKPNTTGRDLTCSSSHLSEDILPMSATTLPVTPPWSSFQESTLNISVANVANLQLTGETTECALHVDKIPQITCSGEGGFAFRDVQNLTLSSLSISHCGQPVQPAGMDRAALEFSKIQNLLLQSMTVFNTSEQ